MTMSAFRKYPRTWCGICSRRELVKRMNGEACYDCARKLWEAAERDEELRSWRRYTDEERARI